MYNFSDAELKFLIYELTQMLTESLRDVDSDNEFYRETSRLVATHTSSILNKLTGSDKALDEMSHDELALSLYEYECYAEDGNLNDEQRKYCCDRAQAIKQLM